MVVGEDETSAPAAGPAPAERQVPDGADRDDPGQGADLGFEVFAKGQRNSVCFDWDPRTREFWFTAGNGKRIHSFLVLPPGFDDSVTWRSVITQPGESAFTRIRRGPSSRASTRVAATPIGRRRCMSSSSPGCR